MRDRLSDPRLWCLAIAALLAALTLALPRLELRRDVVDVVAIVDITGSMQTRDMSGERAAMSRLEAAKGAITKLLMDLPCQSRLGLGVFTERRSFLLFNPVEVCADFAPLEQAISNLEWRMGWEGDSFVAKGLYSAIDLVRAIPAHLVFITDGHEAPPLPPGAGPPPFEGETGRVKGLIVGAGGKEKVPLPKFDDEGREIGVYGPQDVVQENRSGPPPPDAESRQGYHPKWAPFGSAPPEGDEHLTSVRREHLERLARISGLAYTELSQAPDLVDLLMREARPRQVIVPVDIRPFAAGGALALLTLLYGAPLIAGIAAPILITKLGQHS